jgi:hypothetical protein
MRICSISGDWAKQLQFQRVEAGRKARMRNRCFRGGKYDSSCGMHQSIVAPGFSQASAGLKAGGAGKNNFESSAFRGSKP